MLLSFVFFFSFSFSGFTGASYFIRLRVSLFNPRKKRGFFFFSFFFFTPWMHSIHPLLDPFGSLSRESLRALCFHFSLSGFMSSFFLLSLYEFISFICFFSLPLSLFHFWSWVFLSNRRTSATLIISGKISEGHLHEAKVVMLLQI